MHVLDPTSRKIEEIKCRASRGCEASPADVRGKSSLVDRGWGMTAVVGFAVPPARVRRSEHLSPEALGTESLERDSEMVRWMIVDGGSRTGMRLGLKL